MDLLTSAEAARFLNVSRSFLETDRYKKTGKIPFCRISERVIRYRVSDLEKIIKDRMAHGKG